MASIDVVFTSTYHTKQLNPWPNSSASRVVNYSQLSACQGDMQPFEGDVYTRGRLTSLRNKPQQKQPGQLSASIPGWIVSQHVQLSFDGEKCVLLLCAWKPAFLRSGHICDWACKNRAYLHKLHVFIKWYFSWFVLKVLRFCNFSLLSYWFVNMA